MYDTILFMKKFFIKLIKIYQSIPFSSHKACRFIPTCSNYAIEAINEYGAFKGLFLSFKRILKCNPWHKMGYDPVPKKNK